MLIIIAILLAIIASTLLFGAQITLVVLGCLAGFCALIMLIRGIALKPDIVLGLIGLVVFGVIIGVNLFGSGW